MAKLRQKEKEAVAVHAGHGPLITKWEHLRRLAHHVVIPDSVDDALCRQRHQGLRSRLSRPAPDSLEALQIHSKDRQLTGKPPRVANLEVHVTAKELVVRKLGDPVVVSQPIHVILYPVQLLLAILERF